MSEENESRLWEFYSSMLTCYIQSYKTDLLLCEHYKEYIGGN